MIELYCEDCFDTMKRLGENSIDLIITSPFYNTNKKAGKNSTVLNTKVKEGQYQYVRYDVHVDNMTNQEYSDYTVRLFDNFDKIITDNGVVLYNINYGAENTTGMFEAIHSVINKTKWTIADVIVWKKKTALPNSCSSNRLTRIYEFIFVFARINEIHTFYCNKNVVSRRKNGQKMYENIYNFIEAKNNDGSCPYNKATYSTELCEKLITMYAPEDCVIYDPFMGTGTTAVASERQNRHCIGSELSHNQVRYSVERILSEFNYMDIGEHIITNIDVEAHISNTQKQMNIFDYLKG